MHYATAARRIAGNHGNRRLTEMKSSQPFILLALALLLAILAVAPSSRGRAEQADAGPPPVAYVWGSQLTVYYPAQKKIYVYSELGGNCVYAYTLSTPGGPITRENCR
jgi:hypothetical protein